jgi:hypothetical protein
MKWRTLSKNESKTVMERWNGKANAEENPEYKDIRESLMDYASNLAAALGQYSSYKFDLNFAIKLYDVLSIQHGLDPRSASDDGIWRYLSIHIIPDLVEQRWGLHEGRFWKDSRRIWLKTLWWYIYLSWQGDLDATFKALQSNTTDEIVQLVERSGPLGYRIELCREIMAYYGQMDDQLKKRTNKLFRRVMKLNTARSKVVEPSLGIGGEQAYAKELFKYFA